MKKVVVLAVLTLLIPLATLAGEQAVETIRVVKTSPMDEKAVIKVHGKLQVIKVGDELSAIIGQVNEIKVTEISKDMVVLEETGESGPETVIIRLEDGKQKVERMRKTADRQQPLQKSQ